MMFKTDFSLLKVFHGKDVWLLIFFWLFVRVVIYSEEWGNLQEVMPYKDQGMWYFPGKIVGNDLWGSLWYLANDPPLPQLFFGLFLKIFEWPFPFPLDSFFVSVLILFSACLMRSVLLSSGVDKRIALVLAVLWVLNPVCVAAEMEAWQRGMYEALSMFLLMLLLWVVSLRGADHAGNGMKYAAGFCFVVSMLVMTRSSYSLFFLVAILLLPIIYGKKWIFLSVIFLVPQFCWALKNYHIYGVFSLETSAFSGSNIISGVANSGALEKFLPYLHADSRGTCIVELMVDGYSKCYQDHVDAEIVLNRHLGLPENYSHHPYVDLAVSKDIKMPYMRFVVENPSYVFRKIYLGYSAFWGDSVSGFSPLRAVGDDAFFRFLCAGYVFLKCAAFILVHVFSFPLLFFSLNRIWMRAPRRGVVEMLFFCGFSCFAYYALLTSLVEQGENNRFRFAVEPLVWLLPVLSLRYIKELQLSRNQSTENLVSG